MGLAEKLLLSKIHAKLGLDRCRHHFSFFLANCPRCTHGLYSGAAPLSHDTMAFMRSIGLVIGEVGATFLPSSMSFSQSSCYAKQKYK